VLQGRKFDPDGEYVRRWIPELARLSREQIHAPWEISTTVLADAGIRLGQTYPTPVVDHVVARNEALAAYKTLRSRPAAGMNRAPPT
jgi:deoxyribodipyrimidine photo-lyase